MLAICRVGGDEPEPTPVVPDGETVTPTDNVATWVECAGITKPYTNLTQILEDVVTLSTLVSDENAVNYMVRSTTWADTICANQNAMSYIGLNNYCANTLLNDETWCEDICNSEYFESVLNVKVPTMTSDTTPSGIASASSIFNYQYAFKSFNDIPNTGWHSEADMPQWVCYEFPNEVKIYKVELKTANVGGPKISKIQGSNDGTTWDDMGSFPDCSNAETTYKENYKNEKKYLKYRLYISSSNYFAIGHEYATFISLQFYGREDI